VRHRILLPPTLLLLAACAVRVPPQPPTAPFPLAEVWRVALDPALEGERLAAPLVSEGETLFVVLENGSVRALEAASGQRLWEAQLGPGTLAAAPGFLILKQRDGTVVSLDPATGSVVWTVATDAEGTAPPALLDRKVAVAGRTLALLDAQSGKRLWTTGGLGTFSTAPVFAGQRLLAGTQEGLLRCVELGSGRALWAFDTGQPVGAPPVVDDRDRAFLAASDGRIVGLTLRSGNVCWTWRVGSATPHAGLMLKDAILFVSYSAEAHTLVRANGHLAWRTALPSRPLASAVRRGPLLLALVFGPRENSSTVVAITEAGKRLSTFDITGEVVGAPLVVGERLVVALREQAIVALAPAPPPTPSPKPTGEGGGGAPTPSAPATPEAAPPASPATP
jgi:outer membrane protein assembly factor BamB